MWRKIAVLIVFALAVGPVAAAQAGSLPPGFSDHVVDTIPGGAPTAMAWAPDGSNRLFVLDQGGKGYIVKNGSTVSTPFVSLTVGTGGERGLLGIAFDPDFNTNHFIYLYYTTTVAPNPHNRVSRFTMTGDTAGSELPILDLPALGATNHNGGALHFGSDGKLYIGVGENAVSSNAQSLNTPLGKILRINSDGSIPTNPFDSQTTGINKAIWAMGLRNPFTFNFDPDGSHRMFINDVGQDAWEEVDPGSAGANYGWPTTEGTFNQSAHPTFTEPIYTYSHDPECAITGAEFYRPSTPMFPASYEGNYFFSDLCGQWIRMMDQTTHHVTTFEANTPGQEVDIRTGPDGALYYVSRIDSSVHRISYSNTPPTVHISKPLSSTMYRVGATVHYVASATDIDQKSFASSAYAWKVELLDGANPPVLMTLKHPKGRSGSFRIPVTSDKSTTVQYRFTVTVTDAGGATATDTVTINPALVTLNFMTSPSGLNMSLDGVSHTTPYSQISVVGMPYTLSAPSQAQTMGTLWQFRTWKPGGRITHTLKTPSKNTTYVASYVTSQVLNGSFESASGKGAHPLKWQSTRLAPTDGRDCATPAQNLSCSLRLGGASTAKTVSQKLKLVGVAGDSFTLDFWWQTSGASANGYIVSLIILNKNHTTTSASFTLPSGDHGWTEQTVHVSAVRPYGRVQVTIKSNTGAGGSAWFDTLTLAAP